MAPVIGVTATLKEDVDHVAERPLGRFVRADFDYVEGVAEAGGIPIVLPPVGERRAAETIISGLDGLLLTGGSDLHPRFYGEEPIPELDATIPERDAFEMALIREALDRGIPVFGICRGLQVLNVALGGTLYQDLPAQYAGKILKHRQAIPKTQPTHEVEVFEKTCVGGIVGSSVLEVNSYHHQGIKDLAGGLVVAARADDGIIEAIEARDFSEGWIVGVQWHAEAMRAAAPEQREFFRAHVLAAENHATRRAAA